MSESGPQFEAEHFNNTKYETNLTETLVADSVEQKPTSSKSKRRKAKPALLAVQNAPIRKQVAKLPKQLRTISAWRLDSPKREASARHAVRLPAACRNSSQWQLHPALRVEPAATPGLFRRTAKLPTGLRTAGYWEPVSSELAEYVLSLPLHEGNVNTKRIVEAILFAANKPMTVKQIQQVFPELEQPDTLDIQEAIEAIAQDYLSRPIGLKRLASGYRFQVKESMAPWVSRIFAEKPQRYSRATLETLAIIAYRQPVTRGEIEDIRGVSVSSNIIQSLLEREWIREIGHKEVPGRPALLGTTKQFLDYFNLSTLSELPPIEDFANLDFNLTAPTQQDQSERPQTELFPTNES